MTTGATKRLAGLLCFAAGCVFLVVGVVGTGRDVVQIGLAGVLIALGLFWMGPRRRRRGDVRD